MCRYCSNKQAAFSVYSLMHITIYLVQFIVLLHGNAITVGTFCKPLLVCLNSYVNNQTSQTWVSCCTSKNIPKSHYPINNASICLMFFGQHCTWMQWFPAFNVTKVEVSHQHWKTPTKKGFKNRKFDFYWHDVKPVAAWKVRNESKDIGFGGNIKDYMLKHV